jgi:Tol biopolymer transport system component
MTTEISGRGILSVESTSHRRPVMRTTLLTALATAMMLTGAQPLIAQSGHDLFQQALVMERANGQLQEAIALYERIAEEFAADRELAAKSLLRVGQCYETLGSTEARRAYDRLVREFSDQSEVARFARKRLETLAALAADPGPGGVGEQGVVFRQIGFDGLEDSPFAKLSPDGEEMVYVQTKEARPRYSLRVRSLTSGDEVVLVDSVGTVSVYVEWSSDGSQIAYGGGHSLRAVNAKGRNPRVVWSSPEPGTRVFPLDWTPEGDSILVAVRDMANWTHQLLIVPLSGGVPRPLISGGLYELLDFGQFSPGGSYIAGMQTKDGNADVYVWTVDGSEEIRVTTHAESDVSPFWSPDGRFLVFYSDRSGDYDLWAVPMQGGSPGGAPFRVKAGLGRRAMPTGVTDVGAITFLTYGEGAPSDLFVMDVADGQAVGGFRPLLRHPTQHSQPRWAPDGEHFAYTSRKGEIGWPRIFVGSGSNQRDIELPMQDHYPVNVEWGRDGEHVIFPGWRRGDGRVGIFRLSLEERSIEALHLGDPPGPGYRGALVNLHWLPLAGRFFLQQIADSSRVNFMLMDEMGDAVEPVMESVPTNYWAWPSPDGRHVAYRDELSLRVASIDDRESLLLTEWQDSIWFDVMPGWSPEGREVAWTDKTRLATLDLDGGSPRSLAVAKEGSLIMAPPVWSPDGTHVAYVVRDTSGSEASHTDGVWIVPTTGGVPRQLAQAPNTHPRLRLEAWLPNGTLAATGSPLSGTRGGYQHWVLEGFLPKEDEEPQR